MEDRNVGISYSKHRNALGMVGIIVKEQVAYVQYAREWPRTEYKNVAREINALYQKHKWTMTHIDILCGHYIINDMQKKFDMPLEVITTQKDMKDSKDIENLVVMDKIEMTGLVVMLKNNHQIKWPLKPTIGIRDLEAQLALFTEHKTEAGGVDYYAPGDEHDDMTKGLMIALMARRKELQMGQGTGAVAGPVFTKHTDPNIELEELLGDYKI